MLSPDFVDARVHEAERPQLEYLLPEAARAVRDCVLGDGDASAAERAVEALLDAVRSSGARKVTADVPSHPADHADPADAADPGDAPWDASPELHRASALVCSHAADYLATLADEWGTLLTRKASAVQEEERAARATLSRAVRGRPFGRRAPVPSAGRLSGRVPRARPRLVAAAQPSRRRRDSRRRSPPRTVACPRARSCRSRRFEARKAQRPVAKRFAAHVRAVADAHAGVVVSASGAGSAFRT